MPVEGGRGVGAISGGRDDEVGRHRPAAERQVGDRPLLTMGGFLKRVVERFRNSRRTEAAPRTLSGKQELLRKKGTGQIDPVAGAGIEPATRRL